MKIREMPDGYINCCAWNKQMQDNTKNKIFTINSIPTGIAENSIFIFVVLIILNLIPKEYNAILDPFELYIIALQFLSVPLLNLVFKYYRSFIGNLIGIPVIGFLIMLIFMITGFRG